MLEYKELTHLTPLDGGGGGRVGAHVKRLARKTKTINILVTSAIYLLLVT